MSRDNSPFNIHPPHLIDAPDVAPPRDLVDEMDRERRPVPSPPSRVSSESLIATHTDASGPLWGLFDEEARRNRDSSNRYIEHGSLLVPRSREAEFEKAERYLSKDPEAMGVLYRLEHDSREHVVRIGDDVRDDERDGNIAWNPHLGTMDDHGHRISPALSLLHEEDHAIEDPDIQARLSSAQVEGWTDLEEERVITGVENRAARILGEGVRDSHESNGDDVPIAQRGDYWVDSVTSAFPSRDQHRALPDEKRNYAPGGRGR